MEDLVIEYLAALDAYAAMTEPREMPVVWHGSVPDQAVVAAKSRLDHALAALRAAVA